MKINKTSPDEHIFLKRMTAIANCPKSLYFIGSLPTPPLVAVAIVGSRRPTSYGRTVTQQIAEAVARRGAVVVSGMALGIDAIAHATALEVGGTTVAVLPSGLDNPYPKTNRELARRILRQGGALISEYDAGYQPHEYDFVLRNRIVSGLADAIVVTEANLRSGTMATVGHALEQGRPVYAVPGPITSPLSAGCNRLIAQGATPITDVESFLGDIGLSGQQKIAFGENDAEATVLQLLQTGLTDGDELLIQSSLDPALFATTLTMLEIRGLIHPLGNNRWRL